MESNAELIARKVEIARSWSIAQVRKYDERAHKVINLLADALEAAEAENQRQATAKLNLELELGAEIERLNAVVARLNGVTYRASVEIVRLREVFAAVTLYAESSQIPSESDDDWINAKPLLAILAKPTDTTKDGI